MCGGGGDPYHDFLFRLFLFAEGTLKNRYAPIVFFTVDEIHVAPPSNHGMTRFPNVNTNFNHGFISRCEGISWSHFGEFFFFSPGAVKAPARGSTTAGSRARAPPFAKPAPQRSTSSSQGWTPDERRTKKETRGVVDLGGGGGSFLEFLNQNLPT